jgi:hypothetical protein
LYFNETFAPVVRIESVRVIFALAAANHLYILHIDCKNAFLHGESDIQIYIPQPEGFVDERFPEQVVHLNKSLYGLKQAPRIWYLFLCGVGSELKFVALETDSCIHVEFTETINISLLHSTIIKSSGPRTYPANSGCKHPPWQLLNGIRANI